MSAEPSMEEILSSIKRIIAEEGEGTQARARRARAAPQPIEPEPEEVLELSDPMPQSRMEPARVEQPRVEREMARVDAEIIEPLEALMAAGDEKRAEETAARCLAPAARATPPRSVTATAGGWPGRRPTARCRRC